MPDKRTNRLASGRYIDEARVKYLFELNKSNATRRTIFDVFPFGLSGDDRNVGELKEPMRFNVIHHFVGPFVFCCRRELRCRCCGQRRTIQEIGKLIDKGFRKADGEIMCYGP